MQYKTLFIDLDDTIWDTLSNGKESLEEVYRDYKFDRFFPTFDLFYGIYFPNNCNLWRLYSLGEITKEQLIYERFLYPLRPFGIEDRSFISNLNDDFLHRVSLKTKLLPHALEILAYLRPKYKMVILSNGFHEVQYKKINNSGLSSYFDKIILSDDIGINKPNPELFHYALEQTGSIPEETLMIGDSWITDIAGSRESGIDQVWYNPDGRPSGGFTPTFQIASLLDLKNII